MTYNVVASKEVKRTYKIAKQDSEFRNQMREYDSTIESFFDFWANDLRKTLVVAIYSGWYISKYGAEQYKQL